MRRAWHMKFARVLNIHPSVHRDWGTLRDRPHESELESRRCKSYRLSVQTTTRASVIFRIEETRRSIANNPVVLTRNSVSANLSIFDFQSLSRDKGRKMASDKSFASVIRVNIALLQLSGVVPCRGGIKDIYRGLQNVLSVVGYCCILSYSTLYTFEFILYTVHFDTWMESFAMILSIVGGQVRFTILLLFQSRFRRLLKLCEDLWATLSAIERKCVCDYVKATKRLTYFYLFSCAFTIFFYGLASLFVEQDGESTNVTVIRTLPYVSPIVIQQSPYYEIMYVMQICSMTNVGLVCAAADTVGPVLVLTVSGHFRILNSRIQRLCDSKEMKKSADVMFFEVTNEQKGSSRINRAMVDLKACIRYHQIVLE